MVESFSIGQASTANNFNRSIENKPDGEDRCGRTFSEVFAEGKSVNIEMGSTLGWLRSTGERLLEVLGRPCFYALGRSTSVGLLAAVMASPQLAARVAADWLIPSNFDTATAVIPNLRMAQWHKRLLE